MFELITNTHKETIDQWITSTDLSDDKENEKNLLTIINSIHADIPEKKRISCGRYSIIKKLGNYIFPLLQNADVDIYRLGNALYKNCISDPFVRSLGVQLVSLLYTDKEKLNRILALFEAAASDDQWIVRECCAGFIRKCIKKYPEHMLQWYRNMATSDNPMKRRFAMESIRPVADNGWFKRNPKFAFSILPLLYKESSAYPRTSVGNSLSDWMRIDEKRTIQIVRALASNGDKNSYWIAYRACRNLVKKHPLLVMDILNIDSYKYKERGFNRKDYER